MIKFGTDGWRALIARDFNFENVKIIAYATAKYLKANSSNKEKAPIVVVGYDTRFLSREFAEETARVLAWQGILVHLTDDFSSTPQVSYHTKQKGADLGIVITASHNPPEYSGFKVKASFGGPATPDQVADLEVHVHKIENRVPNFKHKDLQTYIDSKEIRLFNAKESYIRYIKKKIDINAIIDSGLKIVYDPMHGAGIKTLKNIIPDVFEIHDIYNPSFGEVDHPEPINECLFPLIDTIKENNYSVGLATDGDADRLGAVDEDGNFVDSHKIFMILMKYLYEDKKKRGSVVKTVSLTSMVNMYCEDKGIKLHETPVGFKHTAKIMTEEKVLIGGEESGGLGTCLHIPERDGIFNGLLLLEVMAIKKKTLKELCQELDDEFGVHRYLRRDVKVTEKQKQQIMNACKKMPTKLGRFNVERIDDQDGYKFYVDNGWLLIRASGTEPLLRFYSEADSLIIVNELLDEGMKLK